MVYLATCVSPLEAAVGSACTTDLQCNTGVCNLGTGRCITPRSQGIGKACGEDEDCVWGAICASNICVETLGEYDLNGGTIDHR